MRPICCLPPPSQCLYSALYYRQKNYLFEGFKPHRNSQYLNCMDRICGAVLNKIHALSPAGRYVIIDEEELYDAFPEGSTRSFDELKKTLTYLLKQGYIDVKYSRGEIYCIAPLKRYEEEIIYEAPSEEVSSRPRLDPVLISAFAGSCLGSLLISLIFAFI